MTIIPFTFVPKLLWLRIHTDRNTSTAISAKRVFLQLYPIKVFLGFLSNHLLVKPNPLFQTQKHPEYNGPTLGPKMADEHKRDWDEDQQRQLRDGQIGLQMGQNKGATQSGMGALNNTRHM